MQSIREIKPSNPRILSTTPINGYLYYYYRGYNHHQKL